MRFSKRVAVAGFLVAAFLGSSTAGGATTGQKPTLQGVLSHMERAIASQNSITIFGFKSDGIMRQVQIDRKKQYKHVFFDGKLVKWQKGKQAFLFDETKKCWRPKRTDSLNFQTAFQNFSQLTQKDVVVGKNAHVFILTGYEWSTGFSYGLTVDTGSFLPRAFVVVGGTPSNSQMQVLSFFFGKRIIEQPKPTHFCA